MASTVSNVINCCKWHRLLQMASTVANGIDCCKCHRLLQMPSTVTNGIDCCKSNRLLQMASTVANPIDCCKWHRLLQMTSTVYERENVRSSIHCARFVFILLGRLTFKYHYSEELTGWGAGGGKGGIVKGISSASITFM